METIYYVIIVIMIALFKIFSFLFTACVDILLKKYTPPLKFWKGLKEFVYVQGLCHVSKTEETS